MRLRSCSPPPVMFRLRKSWPLPTSWTPWASSSRSSTWLTWSSCSPPRRNNEALSDEEFAELFTEDKPVLFAYHSYARDVRGLIYDRPNHDNFNVHGYEEQGSTTTPYDMVRVNNIDRYELQAEALRMIDADKYADKINELEAFRQEAFQFAVDNGYDHPDYTDWVYSGVNTNKQGAVSATAATAGDNE